LKRKYKNKKRSEKEEEKQEEEEEEMIMMMMVMKMTMMIKKKEQENILNSYIVFRVVSLYVYLQVLTSVCTGDMRQYSRYPSTRYHNTEVCNTNLHNLQIQLYPLLLCLSRRDANAKQIYFAS